ncbi:MAG TPA: hypothetical protein VM753_12060 [Anaeromyxobacter sp.]|nr:hypothetical protein [Anaeromyxobacter sp.]
MGRRGEAAAAHQRVLALTANQAERPFLRVRVAELGRGGDA